MKRERPRPGRPGSGALLVALLVSLLCGAPARPPTQEDYEEYDGEEPGYQQKSPFELEMDAALKHCLGYGASSSDQRNDTNSQSTCAHNDTRAAMNDGSGCQNSPRWPSPAARVQQQQRVMGDESAQQRNRIRRPTATDSGSAEVFSQGSEGLCQDRGDTELRRRLMRRGSVGRRDADDDDEDGWTSWQGGGDHEESSQPAPPSGRQVPADGVSECAIHCVFAKVQLVTAEGLPDEALLVKRLEDNIPEPRRRLAAIRNARGCFERLGTGSAGEDDSCLYTMQLAECLHLDIAKELHSAKGNRGK